jgi:hypothetical protein
MATKKCSKCGDPKPVKAFSKHTRSKDGRDCWCKECRSKQDKRRDPERKWEARLWRQYKMLAVEYYALRDTQHNACAICLKAETALDRFGKLRRLCVDHNHATGENRRLLCHCCNLMLGYALDNPATLRAGADYLESFT